MEDDEAIIRPRAGLTFHASAGFLGVLSLGTDGYDFVAILAELDT
jgi:hypothetical protein